MEKKTLPSWASDRRREYPLTLPHRCNFACVVCPSPYTDEESFRSLDDFKMEVLKAKSQGFKNIELGGSEPTLHPHLPEMVRHIIGEGLMPVILTNGSRFCFPAYAKQFLGLNPLGIKIKYHASDRKLFDELSGYPGSWGKVHTSIKVIQEILEIFPKRLDSFLSVSVAVNSYNAYQLTDMVSQIHDLGVRMIQFSPVILSGDVYKRLDVLVNPGDIVDDLRAALTRARSLKMPYRLYDFPPCIIEDQASFIMPDVSVGLPGWIKFNFCDQCEYNPACRGIHKGFIMKKYAPELRQLCHSGQETAFKGHLTKEDLALLEKF